MKHRQFIFESYTFDAQEKHLSLVYKVDDVYTFTENIWFDFEFVDFDKSVLDRALQNLFFMAGVSYFKTFIPPEIVIKSGQLDTTAQAFFSKTYQRGLGEFWYVNNLDPTTPVTLPVTSTSAQPLDYHGQGLLVGLGGGKDSLVTLEMLRNKADILTWNATARPRIIEDLVAKSNVPHLYIRRQVDPQLADLTKQGAYSGHIPYSAVIACLGTVIAVLCGRRDVVVSNEQSANEETLQYRGVSINHQYSKTQEFEQDYQQLLKHYFGDGLRYYSFLRPLSELRITEVFAALAFKKYKDVFSSCNKSFLPANDKLFWCGVCPKCVFIFLALTPFVDREDLESLWGGKNLLLDSAHIPIYKQLLGIEGDKPMECIGEVRESRAAMRLAQEIYPELKDRYSFDLPEGYDYKALHSHEMPPELFQIFEKAIRQF